MAAEEHPTSEQDVSGPAAEPTRAATGVEGVDAVLGGGVLRRRMYVIEGAAGAGKTTLALHFMLGRLHASEQGLRHLNETLDRRVTEGTAALAQQTQRLEHEIGERQCTQEALVQREKLAALGTLLANVAHELNNPLAVATVQLDNLQEAWGAGAWTEDIEVLRQAVDRCTSMVQSFLALARQEPPTRQAVALNAVIGDVLVLVGHTLEADGITRQLHLADDLMPLWADANQPHHAVSNLLTNAHDALRQAAPPRRLTLTTAASADRTQVLLTVTDTGPGIPEDLQRHIFEPLLYHQIAAGGQRVRVAAVPQHGGGPSRLHPSDESSGAGHDRARRPAGDRARGPGARGSSRLNSPGTGAGRGDPAHRR